jgi:putative SOS response-associated peptidase YedK
MCGRFTLHHSTEEVADRFAVDTVQFPVEARYNIAPQQPIATVTAAPDGRRLDGFRWGLVPFWAKDPTIGGRMINARAETLLEKPAFKNALARRRCLIPADGFYEWAKQGAKRQPMHIHLKRGDLFAFAGLWEEWNDPAAAGPDAPPLRTCTIITVAPNAVVAPIHDRMPAILRPEDETHWLDPSIRDGRALLDLLGPYAQEETMNSYAVSRLVNAPGNDDPECIAPLDEELAAAAA